ncbi:MAG: hypothetical protein ACOYJC_11160 [Christensenellales bacterium]|jgi:hypothetical protein
METDVRRYFHSYMLLQKTTNSLLTRTASGLCRGGITDMDILCELLNKHPEKLLQIRNIGEKSLALSRAVCASYRRGKDGAV